MGHKRVIYIYTKLGDRMIKKGTELGYRNICRLDSVLQINYLPQQ